MSRKIIFPKLLSPVKSASTPAALFILISLLFAQLIPAQGQTLKVRLPFDDAGTTTSSDTGGGGVAVTLTLANGANVATDYHGSATSGVAGASKALDFRSNTAQ